ncbi:hypothetical protein SAMN02745133_02224 [Desulforamulus putei DSM 12395]|uniref:DUF4402 domain-containing protein n=1 Tax=Desulforamulus putei DSM 12395 TaxID=1121429 RepID=A0A1M5A993_9FIRM|nr:hypothetical protein [Desulforamulus putei]SHF26839.1 hypothetical protein SAMN02745133_02224 [Desulforamulus putei DSM 12395]
MVKKVFMALLLAGAFLIFPPSGIVMASSEIVQQAGLTNTNIPEPEPPVLEGQFIGILPTVVSSSTPTDMALTSVSGIPESLMVEVKSGGTTVAVLRGNEILFVRPFRVDKSQVVELRLAGKGIPVNSRLIFQPVRNELWGELNINILPPNSELTGQFGINILPSKNAGLSGQFSINILK